MKTVWVLLAIALALLFWSLRERFAETDTIKKPPISATEITRVKALYLKDTNLGSPVGTATLTDDQIKTALEGFWPTWEAEQNRITMNQITAYTQGLTPAEKRAEYTQLLNYYYINQGQNVFSAAYQTLIGGGSTSATGATGTTGTAEGTGSSSGSGGQTSTGGSSTDGPQGGGSSDTPSGSATGATGSTGATGAAGESVLARSRPGTGDAGLRQQVASYLLIPQTDPLVNTVILEVRRFYDQVYVPGGKRMPTTAQIQSFVSGSTIAEDRKPGLTSVIDYWFTEPASPGDSRLESTPSGAQAGRGGAFATYGRSANMGEAQGYDERIWGPPFTGRGVGRDFGGDGSGDGGYPFLLGPPPKRATVGNQPGRFSGTTGRDYGNTLPSSASLGSDPLSGFLPFSRQPGDMDVIPDPYRVSQSYSPSSYSAKNEPVPFLTDFSAFLK